MAVSGYTGDGKVICRWMNKGEVKTEQFVEAELEKWVGKGAVGFGRMQGDVSDYDKKW
jgi:uncharacterized protein YodC (DUF2158 family)